MRKKNLILIVRRSYLEIEYILPVLLELKKKFFISTFFLKYDAYRSLKLNKNIYKTWQKININYYIYSFKDNFFLRFIRLVLKNFIRNNRSIDLFFEKKLHSYNFILNKLNLNNENTLLVLGDYNNFNTWFKNIFILNKKDRPVIINYPSSPTVILRKIRKKISNKILYCDLLFLNHIKEKKYWGQFINLDKIHICGIPIFEKNWINKIYSNKKKSKKKNNCYICL